MPGRRSPQLRELFHRWSRQTGERLTALVRELFPDLRLVHVLLLATVAELAFNRVAAAELRPMDGPPPLWHSVLDHFALFCHYFASMLAMGLMLPMIWRLFRDREFFGRSLRWPMAVTGLSFVVLAMLSVVTNPEESLSFWFEASFTAVMLILVLAQARQGGDVAVKIGILFLAAPLLVHFYKPFAFRFLASDELLELPQRVRDLGQWSMVLAALVTPYCFAPRPFFQSGARLGPFVIAIFVSLIGVLLLRQHYEEGMKLAQEGLGIYIGPDAPAEYLALFLMALGTVTWTLTSCLTARSAARREIGVGLGLVVAAGYGFAWPLQYLVGLVGLVHISQASRRVADEELDPEGSGAVVHAPPIADQVWHTYVEALHDYFEARERAAIAAGVVAAPLSPVRLRGDARFDDDLLDDEAADGAASSGRSNTMAIIIRVSEDHSVTRLFTLPHGVAVEMNIARHRGSITSVQIQCERRGVGNPSWTLYARPERLLGIGAHPRAPMSASPVIEAGDRPFDGRFLVHDSGGLTAALMDDGMRARAIALIDGWLAFWPEHGLLYRVEPGNGAPLDHPIPISELAFRGASAEPTVDRLVAVIDLLAEMTRRGLQRDS